jgi:hypothetical protein
MISLTLMWGTAFVLIFFGKNWGHVATGVFCFFVEFVFIFDNLTGWAYEWIDAHGKKMTDEEKEASFLWHLATYLKGPPGVIYLYPGGRIGAPLAMMLTMIVTIIGITTFLLCLIIDLLGLNAHP